MAKEVDCATFFFCLRYALMHFKTKKKRKYIYRSGLPTVARAMLVSLKGEAAGPSS